MRPILSMACLVRVGWGGGGRGGGGGEALLRYLKRIPLLCVCVCGGYSYPSGGTPYQSG